MKKHILWAIVAVLLVYAGPAFSKDNDDDKFAKPQIDVISDVEQSEPTLHKSSKEKRSKRHPEDIDAPLDEAQTQSDATDSNMLDGDLSEISDTESSRHSKRSKKRKYNDEPEVAEEKRRKYYEEDEERKKKNRNDEPVATPEIIEDVPPQKPAPPQPEPVVQPPVNAQPQKPPVNSQGAQTGAPQAQPQQGQAPQGHIPQGQVPPQGKPVQTGQPAAQGQQPNPAQQQNAAPQPQQQVPVNQQPKVEEPQVEYQKPPVNHQGAPAQQPTYQQQQPSQPIPQAPVEEPVKRVLETKPEPARVQQAPVVEEKSSKEKKERNRSNDDLMDEEQYMNMLYENDQNYLDKYTVYSDTLYTHLERFFKEAVVPVYQHIRANPELSLGFSTLIVMYFIHLVFRILGRIFRRKPKFVYNREEVMSHADINNNFKKFVTELENLKKQIDTTSKKGGSGAQGEPASAGTGPVTAAIPQNLQNEISYIVQNLSKNEELLNKATKDRKQLDSFLFEFQKEVVESHKAIWNELYQLRKVFSQSKLNMSTSHVKTKSEAKDLDDAKSLSSNPETTDSRRRDDQRETVKKSTEPRSRSVAGAETGPLRARQAAPKERKPVQAETEKAAPSLQNGNGTEPHVPPTHKEEPARKEELPRKEEHVEKLPAQEPFGKPAEEEAQPEVQIPTNLVDAPTHNPFATSTQTTSNQPPLNQNAGPTPTPTPIINMGAKAIPFGVKGRVPVVKQPVIQTSFTHQPEPTAVNSGAKLEPNTEINSGLKATTPLQNNMPPLHSGPAPVETHQERHEEKTAPPEPDQAPEEAKASDRFSGADEALAAAGDEEGTSDANVAAKGFVPPLRGGPSPMGGPMGGMGGPPGQRKPIIPTNKALPIPGRKPGLPGANVFKGPPGNIPRAAVPTQIKQPQGQVQDSAQKTGTPV